MEVHLEAPKAAPFDWKKWTALFAGLAIFLVVYYSPSWPEAHDPAGKAFALSVEGKAAVGLFLMASTWWIFEVIPIGVTAIAIGVFQVLFAIRPAKEAFRDFMDPSVMFIFGSLVIGMAFTKTGLTRRLAYKMLSMAGESTRMIQLGSLLVTVFLTLMMAHTAVAATMFPILLAVLALYHEKEGPSNFGKGLFIGMAWAAGAGSIITFLGSARAPAAASMFKEFTGRDVSFFQLPLYLSVIAVVMVLAIWLYLNVVFKPSKATIPGLRERVSRMVEALGPMSGKERFVLLCVALVVTLMALQSVFPALQAIDRAALMLISTLLFFIFGVLTVENLEELPWNIILLFSGAMSIGFCLWKTGAAEWMAVQWLGALQGAHWWVFVMGIAGFVLVMTNFIMNVAAIAIVLPISLVIANYLGVAPDIIFYAALATAGMPFFLLIGAAPNAIAYESGQFTSGEFFIHGLVMSLILMVVLGVAMVTIWPLLGMPVLLAH
ncbi:MAG: SLC13/DASS family transporter [Magnetococcales bacterium]|nr:SLC13/DASS family transporter [Magnetococcales bacterium]MBF0156445.1 SLC13/DASS family transporter [Magnetococcales bacterium]